MKLELTQKLQQQQILAPQMILSMDILLLTVPELEQRIEKEFSENPALEITDQPEPADEAPLPAAPAGESDVSDIFQKLDSFQSYQSYDGYTRRRSGGGDDERLAMLQNAEGKPAGLKDLLCQQARLIGLESKVSAIAEDIINNLDHRGYLLSPAEEIYAAIQSRCTREDFDRALVAVRGLEPAGVGAEDLKHCLLLQLERDKQEYPLETEIILKHLDDLRENKLPKIAKDLGATMEDIKEAIEIIALLDPLPGSRYEPSPTIYIRPDVIVEKVDGRLEIRVENGSIPQLNISESCRKLLKESRGSPEVASFVRKKIESAQWLIQAVRQRQRTIYDIAVAMVEYQRDFMEKGPERLKAMKMQTIADLVHVHISTISRAIKGKYMQTPWGIHELRFFFTGGVENSQGELESRRNIYRKISEIIEGEDKSHPYSDSDIARILRDSGLGIARRTVTKYREQERIPSSRLRKSY